MEGLVAAFISWRPSWDIAVPGYHKDPWLALFCSQGHVRRAHLPHHHAATFGRRFGPPFFGFRFGARGSVVGREVLVEILYVSFEGRTAGKVGTLLVNAQPSAFFGGRNPRKEFTRYIRPSQTCFN